MAKVLIYHFTFCEMFYPFQNKLFTQKKLRVPNSLDSDQAKRFVGPDLGQNCLQKLSAEDNGS